MDELENLKQELEQEKQKNSDLFAKVKEAEHALEQKVAEFSTFMKQEKEKSLISDYVINFYETIFAGYSLLDVDFDGIGLDLGLE